MEDLIKSIIKKDGLDKACRKQILIHKRMYIFNFMRENGYKLKAIGNFFNLHHATVIHSLKKYNTLLIQNDYNLLIDIEDYENIFGHIPIPHKTRNLKSDIMLAHTIHDLYAIKRRLDNNLYEI